MLLVMQKSDSQSNLVRLTIKKHPFLFCILTVIFGILIKLLFIFCDNFVWHLFGDFMPLINSIALGIVGFGFGYIFLSKYGLFSRIILYLLFIFCTFFVYMSGYYFNYYFWDKLYAKKANITIQEANSKIDTYLQIKTGTKGFIGYLKYSIMKEPGELDTENTDGLLDILVPLMLRLFQWISSLFHLKIAGLIELIFWYIFSWLWIGAGFVSVKPEA